jgi:hypothetical protein
MDEPNRSNDRPKTDTLPPGADRFWGQFSQTRAGRTQSAEEAPETDSAASTEDGQHCLEWCPICRSADIVRATTSPEAIGQVQAIQNEAIGVLRSFLAIYAERTGQGAQTDDSDGTSQKSRSGRPAGEGSSREGKAADGDAPPVRDIWID